MAMLGGGFRVNGSDWPDYREVLELLQSKLPGITSNDVNQAFMLGLEQHLSNRLSFVAQPLKQATAPRLPALVQTNIFDGAYAYFRVAQVDDSLPQSMEAALPPAGNSNQYHGLILDLRYAGGTDYSAAGKLASLFLENEVTLFTVGGQAVKSQPRTNAWKMPVAILVNRETKEAAEVLAGVLRDCNVGLLLGSNTAGCAWVYRDYPLSNGQVIRLATDKVVLDQEHPSLEGGLAPDILVPVSTEEERAYYADAYRQVPKLNPLAAVLLGDTNRSALLSGSNLAPRRLNEAELVRRQKEGLDPGSDLEEGGPRKRQVDTDRPTVGDPALARALDLLKGLAVVQKSRPAAFNR
jgi:hypothetical protein